MGRSGTKKRNAVCGELSASLRYFLCALCVLLSAAALGGLFLGLALAPAGVPMTLASVLSADDAPLFGSLLGVLVCVLRGETFPGIVPENGLLGILPTVVCYWLFAVVLAVVLCIAATIVAFFLKKYTRLCFYTATYSVILSYGTLAVLLLIAKCLGAETFSAELIDFPSVIVAGIGLAVLIGASVARNKWLGVMNFVLLGCISIVAFSAVDPGSRIAGDINEAFSSVSETEPFLRALLIGVFVLTFLNVFLAIVRLDLTRAYPIDAVRYCLEFFAAFTLLITYLIQSDPNDPWSFFLNALTPMLLFLIFSFLSFLLAALISVERSANARKALERRAYFEEGFYGENADSPMNEFERRMLALAKGETPEPAADAETAPQETEPPETTELSESGGDTRYVQQSIFDTNPVYDSFMGTLNARERAEFTELFILGGAGVHDYLPPYVAGGDNRLFFELFFVRLGKFRKEISEQLLDKIYAYVKGE